MSTPTPMPPKRFRLTIRNDHKRLHGDAGEVYGCFWPEWNGGLVMVAWSPGGYGLTAHTSMDALMADPSYKEIVSKFEWLD
jgi:hypothetical protein